MDSQGLAAAAALTQRALGRLNAAAGERSGSAASTRSGIQPAILPPGKEIYNTGINSTPKLVVSG